MENARVRFFFLTDTTQRVNKKSYKAFSMVLFVYFIDTEIVEKPIFVNLTRVLRKLIQLRCMRVKLE